MASTSLALHCGAFRCKVGFASCFRKRPGNQPPSASWQLSVNQDVADASRHCFGPRKGSVISSSQPHNVASSKWCLVGMKNANCLSLKGVLYGNGELKVGARRTKFTRNATGDKGESEEGRRGVRAEQDDVPEEKPKRRRASPRAKKTEEAKAGGATDEAGAPAPKKATTRRRTAAKANADSVPAEDGDTPVVKRPRAPRKKAATTQEETGPSASDLKEEEARGGDSEADEAQDGAGKVRRRRRKPSTESQEEPSTSPEEARMEEAENTGYEQKDSENGTADHGEGNGVAVRTTDGKPGSTELREVVVGEVVTTTGATVFDGRKIRDSVTADVLGDEEELRQIAQKIVDGRARDLKLRPELDKLLDHYFMQECTKCHKVFVGRRPAPEQPYYGICRRPNDGNRWRNEAHNVVDTHVPSAITQPYVITHKLGDQTRYRYRVPAIFAICQMAGATFPTTDNEFFECIRRHDSRYEPFHIGVLDLDQPEPPGGWRKDDSELFNMETRAKKLELLRLDGYEFQDTYMPDDTGTTAKSFSDRSVPVDDQGDWMALTRNRDPYRP